MPFTLLQVGNTLKSVNTDGGLSSALTLPTNVLLYTNRQPRFARFNRYVVVVNTPSRPLSVGPDGVVRPLTLNPPSTAVSLSQGDAAGSLSGPYLALQTYRMLDSSSNIISESDYGPAMASTFSVTSANLVAAFGASPEASVSKTQLYRTTTGGDVYFPWVTANATATSIESGLSDAGLGIIAAPELGTAPDLTLVAEFGGRLWGVDRLAIDDLRYTTAGTMYGWSALNTLKIPRVGADDAGVTALIPRRAALGVARRDVLIQVTGSSRSNFAPTVVNGGEGVGCVSQESVVVFNDVAYFLFRDGVYRWDSSGVRCITNGRVRSWFTTDTYFNRSMFWRAFAQLDPIGLKYRLFLASRGSDVVDRWIEYDLMTDAWFGPHLTTAFSPSCALLVAGRNQQPYFMVGSREGYLSQDQAARNDWGLQGISMSAQTNLLDTDDMDPDEMKYYGDLSVFHAVQTAGSLTVTPVLGPRGEEIDTTPFSSSMTRGRRRLGRVGVGEATMLRFENSTIDQDVVLQGFEITPVHSIGRR